MKAVIFCWSKTGNTDKVAHSIEECLEAARYDQILLRPEKAKKIDWFEYDLICLGFPSYSWHPPGPVVEFLKKKFKFYSKRGYIKPGAPKIPGKNAIIFCTYSGPHTGINEAIPAGQYAGQFFEHLGFTILDEIYVVGEFHGSLENNTMGRLGDIRGRPNARDLAAVKDNVERLLALKL